jgi:hypothetical protein
VDLKSRRAQNRLLAVGVLVLIAGGIAAAVVFIGSDTGTKIPETYSSKPPKDVSQIPKKVKLEKAAADIAQKFLATNVVRRNLSQGYKLVGPDLKEGLTLKQWLTGNIPVVPYPGDVIDKVPIQVIYSYPREAMLRVFMLPKKGVQIPGGAFYLGLKLYGKGHSRHWLVNSWVPYASPKIPTAG